MGRKYTIGEAAALLNVSRDSLRFYEKKNLVMPQKMENGYRYYTDEDIQMLLDLVFLRKLQCSIPDLQTLSQDGSLSSMYSYLDYRMKEEERLIQMHQQMLRQLMVTQHAREKVKKYLDQCILRPIPRTYIFSQPVEDYDSVRNEWFEAIKRDKNLENCYLHEQFNLLEDGSVNHQCYLIQEEYAVKTLHLEKMAEKIPSFQFEQCVYTVYASDTISPKWEDIQRIMHWAKEQNISLMGEVHAHYLWNHYQEGKLKTSYIELYLPVKES